MPYIGGWLGHIVSANSSLLGPTHYIRDWGSKVNKYRAIFVCNVSFNKILENWEHSHKHHRPNLKEKLGNLLNDVIIEHNKMEEDKRELDLRKYFTNNN